MNGLRVIFGLVLLLLGVWVGSAHAAEAVAEWNPDLRRAAGVATAGGVLLVMYGAYNFIDGFGGLE
jgi:thiol:disulfide interchange protein